MQKACRKSNLVSFINGQVVRTILPDAIAHTSSPVSDSVTAPKPVEATDKITNDYSRQVKRLQKTFCWKRARQKLSLVSLVILLALFDFSCARGSYSIKPPDQAAKEDKTHDNLSDKISNDRAKFIAKEIHSVLTTGNDIPVNIRDMAYSALQGDEGTSFTPATPPDNLLVTAETALQQANRVTLSSLTQPPIKTTVEFLNYSSTLAGIKDQKVWRVVFWGSITQPSPPPDVNGKYHPIGLSGSREAVTYVLIDPFKKGGDFITMGSAGKT